MVDRLPLSAVAVSPILCPFCLSDAPRLESRAAHCHSCGTPLVVAGRFALRRVLIGDRAHDAADGVGLLCKGVDLESNQPILARLGDGGDKAMEREVNVLRGLNGMPSVPVVLGRVDGATPLCAMTFPEGIALDVALAGGMRVSRREARTLLRSLLSTLASLDELLPGVHHRAIHPGNVFLVVREEGGRSVVDGRIRLIDFARATDTRADAAPVCHRPGYGLPPGRRPSPGAEDLYAVGALLAHVLTRTAPDKLPEDRSGVPDYRAYVDVDAELARIIDGLLAAGTRRGFASPAAALAALERRGTVEQGARSAGAAAAAGVGAALLCMALFGAGYVASRLERPAHIEGAPAAAAVAAVAESPVRVVRVDTAPSGAELLIDGAAMGIAPLSLALTPGSHVVEARLARHRTHAQTIEVGAGEHSVVLALAANPLRPAPAPPPPPRQLEQPVRPRIIEHWRPSEEELERIREQQREHQRKQERGDALTREIGKHLELRACRPPADGCAEPETTRVTLSVSVSGTDVIVDSSASGATAQCVKRILEERVRAPSVSDGLRGHVTVTLSPSFYVTGGGWR